FTDLHPSNIFVNSQWNVKFVIDLEWACSLPAETFRPPYWLTGRSVDDLIGEHLEDFREAYEEFMDIFEEEEKLFPPINNTYSYRTTLMRNGWQVGNFWYFHALDSPKGLFNLFRQHIYPIFAPSRQVVSDFSRVISDFWAPDVEEIILAKLRDKGDIVSPKSMSRPASKFAEWLARAPVQDKFGLCGLLALAPTPGMLQWLDIPSYLQGGVLAALVIANIIAISLHAQTWADVQKRAGCLAVTHLVPLCSGFSFSLPAHVFRIERGTLQWAHRWLGRICVLHCLLHGSVLGTVARNTSLGASLVIPLLAGCSFVSIFPWTLAAILRRWPQLGLKVHHVLALVATGTLFYHLIDRVSSYRWVLLGDRGASPLDGPSRGLPTGSYGLILRYRRSAWLNRGSTQPVDQIRYRKRNCTRLKYHFHTIDIAKELARLMDGTGGTTAV
ncbi:hypothetical protein PENARI_c242G12223, partial [Penicillium arizonense]